MDPRTRQDDEQSRRDRSVVEEHAADMVLDRGREFVGGSHELATGVRHLASRPHEISKGIVEQSST